ncbi:MULTISPECIES: hypothetical protein [unclassified Moorena]|nr:MULTISPECIES: hypothetical protein [unclassified Moorena]NEQ01168.1 hypothetical protein [Moorena sp. SIO3F7]
MQSLMGETPKTALHRFLPTLQAAISYHCYAQATRTAISHSRSVAIGQG